MNFNTPALLFGLILLVASIALFVFGRLKPELQKDSDSVYAIIGVICSLILFGSAFDLSLGMSFQQLLMIGSLIALMWENIQGRQPKGVSARRGALDGIRSWGSGVDQGRRNGPMDDEGRSAGNVYRYEPEFDDYDRSDDPRRREPRRLRGSEPPRRGYDEFADEPRRERPPARGMRPALNEAGREGDRGRAEFDEFGEPSDPSRRPTSRPPQADVSRSAPRDVPRDVPRNAPRDVPRDDWDNGPSRDRSRDLRPTAADGSRRPSSFESRPPQEDLPPARRRPRGGSMEGSPVSGAGEAADPGLSVRPPLDRSSLDRPPLDRPPMNRPPLERPPLDRSGRPPVDRPAQGNWPRQGPSDRPPLDPNGSRSSEPPVGNDDYVDFKPLTPPPADEMDNSSNFDD